MPRRKHGGGEHGGDERWLLTYADLITLLLGLFVILYAASQVDAQKFTALMQAFGTLLGGGSGVMQGSMGAMEVPVPPKPAAVTESISSIVESTLSDAISSGGASVSENDGGVTVHVAEMLLFDPGAAQLKPGALPVLDSLAHTLSSITNEIRIEGHTDDSPIHSAQYPSNWHLSVDRALNVGYYLMTQSSIRPERVWIVGFGEFRPIAPNTLEQGRARNRRVDIVIVK
ncbi:MAG: OmpA family protein [Acidobacteria bacterium]|nr:OmpA family protein [Acidobacteriota bacterium]